MASNAVAELRAKVLRLSARRDVPPNAPAFSLLEVSAALAILDERIESLSEQVAMACEGASCGVCPGCLYADEVNSAE